MEQILARLDALDASVMTMRAPEFGSEHPWRCTLVVQIGSARIEAKHIKGPSLDQAVKTAWALIAIEVKALS